MTHVCVEVGMIYEILQLHIQLAGVKLDGTEGIQSLILISVVLMEASLGKALNWNEKCRKVFSCKRNQINLEL